MKKIYLFFAGILLVSSSSFSQVTGTKTIGIDYATIALAVTALNTSGVGVGGAIINVPAGYTETAPSGGYLLGTATLNASLSAANPLVIKKNGSGANPVITAPIGTSTSLDGIFRLTGTDYVTIDGIDLKESAANTTATTAMEFGYALFNLNATAPFDGCNNNTIKNCAITMNRTVATASKGIFVAHQVATSTTGLLPTTTADLHNNNKFYSNTISNLITAVYIGGATSANDQGNDVGGSSAATGNTITNVIGALYSSVGAITTTYQNNCNISYNTINNTANGGTNAIATAWAIYAYSPSGTYTLSGNTITLNEAAISTAYAVYGIYGNASLANITAANNTVTISEVSGSAVNMINIFLPNGNNTSITGNIVTQNQALSATTYGIYATSIGTTNISSNIVKQTASVAVASQFYSIVSGGTGISETISDNIFDNTSVAVAGTTGFVACIYTSNATPNKTITGNSINGTLTVNSSADTYFIFNNTTSAAAGGTANISGNSFSNMTKSGTGPLFGVLYSPVVANSQNVIIKNNTFNNLSAGSGPCYGIYLATGANDSIYNNTLKNFSGTGSVYGIYTASPAATDMKIYNNQLFSFTSSGAAGTSNGIYINNGTTVTAFNNFISDLKTTTASITGSDAVTGINIASTNVNTSVNLYHNSIYLNASSIGVDFSSAGIFHAASATATTASLKMINNIIVNTSTPSGTGIVSAYHRSGTSLANYDAGSNNNDFYAGTPAANRLIFYDGTNADQTLAAYKTRVGPTTDSATVSVMPTFTSATDLHLTAANNCGLDGYGMPLAAVTTDIDGNTRDLGAPDMGADEFTATYNTTLAAAAYGTTVSVAKYISPSGTTFVAPNCDLIAKVVPSGASPVSGAVSVAVTRDPSSANLFFNAGPYLTRHYDIDPAANANTATATVTLYFTDQEFTDYNTNNPLWPPFPTVAGGGNSDPHTTNVQVTQYHGTPTTTPSSPGNYTLNPGVGVSVTPVTVNYNGTSWEVTVPVTGFSGFYVYSAYFREPLPITFNFLRGNRQGTTHNLSWSVTCNSTPTATLVLERSANSADFAAITSINATALRCLQPFDYTDAAPLNGTNYYRLKMIDANGKITYSNIITLINAARGLEMMNIAPNPVQGASFKLNISSAKATQLQVVITDMQGRVVKRQDVTLMAGFNSLDMPVAGLAGGTYNIYGTTADDRTRTIRFVKQ